MEPIIDPFNDLENHRDKCRLCLEHSKTVETKVVINRKIDSMIFELRLQLISTSCYSRFICNLCFENLLHLSSFRSHILEKQQLLAKFLCRVKDESSDFLFAGWENIELFKVEPDLDPISFEPVLIKTESLEEDQRLPATTHQKRRLKISQCIICLKRFSSTDSLQTHMTVVHQDVDLPFQQVDFLSSSENIVKHESTSETADHQTKKPISRRKSLIACPTCGKVLKRCSLHNHIARVHKHQRNYCCDYCAKGFFTKQHLQNHIFMHISKELRERNRGCKMCSRAFYSQESLRLHVKYAHQVNEELSCECGKTFKNRNTLYHHKLKTHNKEAQQKTCEHCGKVLSDGTRLKEHIKIFHTEGGRGNFMCSNCGKLYDSQKSLHSHLRSHLERTVVCDEPGCGKKFGTRTIMNKHMKLSHLNLRDFKCDHTNCGKAFNNTQRLKRHIKVTHEKHREKCPVEDCKFMVGRRDYMKNHLRKHNELKSKTRDEMIESVKHMMLL